MLIIFEVIFERLQKLVHFLVLNFEAFGPVQF